MLKRFWGWYEKNETIAVGLTSGLFILQLVHLYWMTAHIVLYKLTGTSYFNPTNFLQALILVVDYTEIPALIGTSLIYLHDLNKKRSLKPLLFLFFLNTQWIHIFWITDEVVFDQFTGSALVSLPIWLAWIGISIDYLELPVIFDTIQRFVGKIRAK